MKKINNEPENSGRITRDENKKSPLGCKAHLDLTTSCLVVPVSLNKSWLICIAVRIFEFRCK